MVELIKTLTGLGWKTGAIYYCDAFLLLRFVFLISFYRMSGLLKVRFGSLACETDLADTVFIVTVNIFQLSSLSEGPSSPSFLNSTHNFPPAKIFK